MEDNVKHLNFERNKMFDCFENNIILPLCNYYDVSYYLYFLGCYQLIYIPTVNKSLLHNGYLDFGSRDYTNGLNKLNSQGIKHVCLTEIGTNKEKMQVICDALSKGKIVAITFDAYYCPWYMYYKELHINHSVIIFGYNQKENSFWCYDSHLSTKYEKIDAHIILEHHIHIYVFNKNIGCSDQMNKCLIDIYDKHDVEKSIITLYNDIFDYVYTSDDKEYFGDLNKSYFFIRFSVISWKKRIFSEAIKFYYPELSNMPVNNLLSELEIKWKKMRGCMWKCLLLGEIKTKIFTQLQDNADNILELEIEVVDRINDFVRTIK